VEATSTFVFILIISFFLGSIPNGELIGRIFFSKDIRATGSGNIGTTNAIRALGKKAGYAVFVLDFSKGLIASLIALWLCNVQMLPASSASAVFTVNDCLAASFLGAAYGHIFCPWLKFRGGKGIAVSVGCLFVVYGPIPAIIEVLGFFIVAATTKYISAGSLTAAIMCPFLGFFIFWGDWLAAILCAVVGITVIWAHRSNIQRLRNGTERRIGHSSPEQ